MQVVVQVIGGLGNQMFQFATGYAIAKKLGAELVLDVTGYNKYNLHPLGLKHWNIQQRFVWRRFSLIWELIKVFISGGRIFREGDFKFNKKIFQIRDSVYLKGYWQSEKYFKEVESELKNIFSLSITDMSEYSRGILSLLASNKMNVSIHVRRGDYLLASNQGVHGVCGLDYYVKAIDFFRKQDSSCRFIVFSDDISWAKQNLELGDSAVFVDGNGVDRNFEDIALMSKCDHHIIANSSFSWWGAWLNSKHNKIVIAPSSWFSSEKMTSEDIYAENWMRL